MVEPTKGQQPSPEEQKFKIKVQGEEKEVPLNELLELAQKGDDYTRKTQSLSEEKRRMEEDTQRKAEDLVEQYLANLEEEKAKKPPVDEGYLDPVQKEIRELRNEIATMKKGSEEIKVAQYQLQYQEELAKCTEKYPMLDKRVVLASMHANTRLKMEDVAKESHTEELSKMSDLKRLPQEAKDAVIKEYLANKSKQPREFGGGPSSPPITPTKPLTGQDLSTGNVKRAATEFIKNFNQE